MEPFATVDGLRAVWPDVTDEGRAQSLLSMVSAAIGSMCDAKAVEPDVLSLVTCQATARMMRSDAGFGVSQESWSASPYSGSVSYANPSGDIYLTSFEKQLLGIGDQQVCIIEPKMERGGDELFPC